MHAPPKLDMEIRLAPYGVVPGSVHRADRIRAICFRIFEDDRPMSGELQGEFLIRRTFNLDRLLDDRHRLPIALIKVAIWIAGLGVVDI